MSTTGPKYTANNAHLTISDLELEIELIADKNLSSTLTFFKATLDTHAQDELKEYFSENTFTETRSKLYHAADERWPNRSTLASQRSRINTLCEIGKQVLVDALEWKRGNDPQFIRCRDLIRSAIELSKYRSVSAFERSVLGKNKSTMAHLFVKTQKYPASWSKPFLTRLPLIANALDLDPEYLRRALVDQKNVPEPQKVTQNTFRFGLPTEEWPDCLVEALDSIIGFHKGLTPGKDPLGNMKKRNERSYWKTRANDGECVSERNTVSFFRTFYGFCVLPDAPNRARELVMDRLKRATKVWTEEDLPKFDAWMTGKGYVPEEACISWLLNSDLVEEWLKWMANRNGGVTETQATYANMLAVWTSPTGAITQSWEIASQVMDYEPLPKRPPTNRETELYRAKMAEWQAVCKNASNSFTALEDGFKSDKIPKKRRRMRKHDQILSEENPTEKLELMLKRYFRLEPTHLGRNSQSWLLWCRNMTMCELMLSNPIRANNFCMLEAGRRGRGHLFQVGKEYELRFAKHEVKNPHKEKDEGYRAKVNLRASAWIDVYLKSVRPHWPTKSEASHLMFLTDSGGAMKVGDFGKILGTISRRCLPEYEEINPHMWRHIIATGWLKTHPNDFVTVSLILADRINTVLREYAHLTSDDGLRKYHASLGAGARQVPSLNGSAKMGGSK